LRLRRLLVVVVGLLKLLISSPSGKSVFANFTEQSWQLGDVARYAPCLIESQSLGDSGIVRVGVAIDVSDGLLVGVHDLEAAV
jgi:hypothetical protein